MCIVEDSKDCTEESAKRTNPSRAVAQLMRITARAEGAVMDGWIRIIEDRLDASPATALQKLGSGQMLPMPTESNSTESKSASLKRLRARLKDEHLRRLDAPPARQKLDQVYKRAPIWALRRAQRRPCPNRRSRSSRLEPKVGSEVVRKGLMWRRSQHFQRT
jgi:hypothetical protein